MITNIGIIIFGCSAIWFLGRTEKWKRIGYILGLLSQPFWFYTTIKNEQWGVLVLVVWYTYSWCQGIYNYWIKPLKKTRVEKNCGSCIHNKKEICNHCNGYFYNKIN